MREVNVAFGSIAAPSLSNIGWTSGWPAEDMTVEFLAGATLGSRPREKNARALKTMVDMILNEEDFLTLTRESFAGKTHGNGLNNQNQLLRLGSDRFTQITFLRWKAWRGKDLNAVPIVYHQ
jgi:hypothetical protein